MFEQFRFREILKSQQFRFREILKSQLTTEFIIIITILIMFEQFNMTILLTSMENYRVADFWMTISMTFERFRYEASVLVEIDISMYQKFSHISLLLNLL